MTLLTGFCNTLRNIGIAVFVLLVGACDSGTEFSPSREVPFARSGGSGGVTPTDPTTPTDPGTTDPGTVDPSRGGLVAASICATPYEGLPQGMTEASQCVRLNAPSLDENGNIVTNRDGTEVPRYRDDGISRESLCYRAGRNDEPLVYDHSTVSCVRAFQGCPDGQGVIQALGNNEQSGLGRRCSGQTPENIQTISTVVVGIASGDDADARQGKIDAAITAERMANPDVDLINVVEVFYDSTDDGTAQANKLQAVTNKVNGAPLVDGEARFIFRTVAVGIEPTDTPAERLAKVKAAITAERATLPSGGGGETALNANSIINVIEVFYDDGDSDAEKERKVAEAMRDEAQGNRFEHQLLFVTVAVGIEPDDTQAMREDKIRDAINARRAEVPNALAIVAVPVFHEADDTDDEKNAALAAALAEAVRGDNQEATALRKKYGSYTADMCSAGGRLLTVRGTGADALTGTGCTNLCADGTFVGDGGGSRSAGICYNDVACTASGGGRAERGSGACIAASPESCYGVSRAGSEGVAAVSYFFTNSRCIHNGCIDDISLVRATSATRGTSTCTTVRECYNQHGRTLTGNRCVASSRLCLRRGGRGFDGDRCVAASEDSCGGGLAFYYEGQCLRATCGERNEIPDARRFDKCISEANCTSDRSAALAQSGEICVSKQQGCPTGQGVNGERCTETVNAATCADAGRFVDVRGGGGARCFNTCAGREVIAGNVCLVDTCAADEVYSPTSFQCVDIDSDADTAATQCQAVGLVANVANSRCVERCSGNTRIATTGTPRCVTDVTRSSCLSNNQAFDRATGECVTADLDTCAATGAFYDGSACVEFGNNATMITTIRGTDDAAADGVDGKQSAALAALREAIAAVDDADIGSTQDVTTTVDDDDDPNTPEVPMDFFGNGADLLLLQASASDTPTRTMLLNRLRVAYANQPSLDQVGAVFAHHVGDSGRTYGFGSTVSYFAPIPTSDREGSDQGLLDLISGGGDVSDAAVTLGENFNFGGIKTLRHSIAPEATLNVVNTAGMALQRDSSGLRAIVSRSGTRTTAGSESSLRSLIDRDEFVVQLQDTNVYRHITGAGAPAWQTRGNVILFDNRMAADKDIHTVFAARAANYFEGLTTDTNADAIDPIGFRNSVWRLDARGGATLATSSFTRDLDAYFYAPGTQSPAFANVRYDNLYIDQPRGNNEVYTLPGGFFTRPPPLGGTFPHRPQGEQLRNLVIEGLYGTGTRLYPTTRGRETRLRLVVNTLNARTDTYKMVDTFRRFDNNELNVIDAIIDLMRQRAATPDVEMDALIFAADDEASDIGLFAGLPIYIDRIRATRDSGIDSPLPYYLAVVAAEEGACGWTARDFCITAPGSYTYAASGATSLSTATSANAAAALVAGGVALLQEIFDGQLGTAEIIARLKATASQNFDVDDDGSNDYVGNEDIPDADDVRAGQRRFGHGLLDLACATRASLTQRRCRTITVNNVLSDDAQACLRARQGFDGSACITSPVSQADCDLLNATFSNGQCMAPRAPRVVRGNRQTCLSSGRGFDGTNCIAIPVVQEHCDPLNAILARGNRCVAPGGAPAVILGNRDSEADVVALFETSAPSFSAGVTNVQRLAREYQNQPSFRTIGVADAYARGSERVTYGSRTDRLMLHDLNLGQGARISYITNSRFDPSHPEFTRDAYVTAENNHVRTVQVIDPVTMMPMMETVIDPDTMTEVTRVVTRDIITELSKTYGAESNIAHHGIHIETAFLTPREGEPDISTLIGGIDAADMGVMALINGLVNPSGSTDAATYASNTHGVAPGARLEVFTIPHLGFYSHGAFRVNEQTLVRRARGADPSGNNNNFRNIVVFSNEMIREEAEIHPVTMRNLIEVVDDRTDGRFGSTGHIPLTNPEGGDPRDTVVGYDTTFRTLVENVRAPHRTRSDIRQAQDIYVFAALDGRGDTRDSSGIKAGFNDAGLFASLVAASRPNNDDGTLGRAVFADYSLVVVAAERYQTYDSASSWAENSPCGGLVQTLCIAAPGVYRYRDRDDDGNYETSLSTGSSANAAAALVAGGVALLESLFGDQLTSDRLVVRLLATASQDFDLSGQGGNTLDGNNDYVDETNGLTKEERFGVGLLDLECATRPIVSGDTPRCRGGVARGTPSSCLSAGQGYRDTGGGSCVSGVSLRAEDCTRAGGLFDIRQSPPRCVTRVSCGADTDEITGRCVIPEPSPLVCGAQGEFYHASSGSCVTNCRGTTTPLVNVAGNTCVNACVGGVRDRVTNTCVAATIVDVGVTGISTRNAALNLFVGDPSESSAAQQVKDIRSEYQAQPSLGMVGAAQAYVSQLGASDSIANLGELALGRGSNIRVITNVRFDPNHPEFASSLPGVDFRTLTRFLVTPTSGNEFTANRPDLVRSSVFPRDSGNTVEFYSAGVGTGNARFTIAIDLTGGNPGSTATSPFEDLSLTEAAALAASNVDLVALQTLFRSLFAASPTVVDLTIQGAASANLRLETLPGRYVINLNSDATMGFQHIGRVYEDGSNIGSYQIVIDPATAVRDAGDEGECVVNEDCYASGVPAIASGAEMGVLALINGLLDGQGGAGNTHGIAPAATLNVYTGAQVGATGDNYLDLVYRARGIDVGRDINADDAVVGDDDRNIVIIQSDMLRNLASGATVPDPSTGITNLRSNNSAVDNFYKALEVGAADTATQDAFIFVADDAHRADDDPNKGYAGYVETLGVINSMQTLYNYSLLVVAAEDGQVGCAAPRLGSALDDLRRACIAAPGTYRYRTRNSTDGTYNDALATAISGDAAASLVAGGLALLESIFPTENTSRLIDRLLMTASQNFDIDNDDLNDYDVNQHGQGLMDLECAVRPALMSGTLARTGCTDRFASGIPDPTPPSQNAPLPRPPSQNAEPVGESQGERADTGGVEYCHIDGLRIILSGDLCSDDYILLADSEGEVNPDAIGNLRFGMGFGDALSGSAFGGITFFDAFDTAWTIDNPYNPYAQLLDFGSIVIAPIESRFDIEDRFYAMRYGTRPGTRKTWNSDTANITMDFATQGMATKPYAVTRGQIRNTITHDNVGADPYADVRFMLSAEDNVGIGRLKVMAYSGMAMGYALGLHAQGDAMMPSYLLTNRDSFHAPYLSLASSGLGGGMTYRFRDGGHIGFVMGEGTSLNADGTLPYQQQTRRPRAFAGMMEYAPHGNLMFHVGVLQEQSTLLASQGSGLFALQGGTTAFFGMQAKQPLGDNWQALVSGYGGRTQMARTSGIVSGLDVVTSSFDVGLLGSHVLEKGDHVLFRAGQPMRVESGTLDLSYVSFRNKARGSVGNVQSLDVAPSMRSVEFGVGYGLPIGTNGSTGHMRFAIDYVLNPGHRNVQDEVFGIMSFRREF
ncbi:MAG: S8 family serine peptidase [Alphaproteobacteria bacterium GM202ARS2]|nr:S8 family serine peptidase [Alphaproteobacteria bacterium GM202ARS2]